MAAVPNDPDPRAAPPADPLEPTLIPGVTPPADPSHPLVPTHIPGVGQTVPHDPPAGPRPLAFDFLAPPRGPDEIGRLGPYRVVQVLGRGGMGVVFRAVEPALKREVALKVILPECAANPNDRARFVREAQAQAAVEHDHVISIYRVGEDRGTLFIAMPLLKGQTLGAALEAEPRPSAGFVLRVGRQMADGLAAAHARGLVHRDIKPANVWLDGDRRRVKLLDFGLARTVEGDTITQKGAMIGTPAYMSPEQARGDAVDFRTDLFSLGAVLYQMATGELPFPGKDLWSILTALVTEEPVPPAAKNPAIPAGLNDLILKLLAKDAANRPASAKDVAAELRRIEAGAARRSTPVPPSAPAVALVPVAEPLVPLKPVLRVSRTKPSKAIPIALTAAPPAAAPARRGVRWVWVLLLTPVVLVAAIMFLGFVVYLVGSKHTPSAPTYPTVPVKPAEKLPAKSVGS